MKRAIEFLPFLFMGLLLTLTTSCSDRAVDSYARGNAKAAKGDFAGAIADFTKAIELKPDYEDAYCNRGHAKKDEGDLEGALADYTKAIQLKPGDADAYRGRGLAKKAKGDLDGALLDYTKAIELKPDFADAYCDRGVAKNARGDLDGAIADYTKTIELKPGDAIAYYNRGIAKHAENDLEGSIADSTKAIQLKPDYVKAYVDRGIARKDKGDLDGAITDYTKAIQLNPKYDWAYFARGCLHYDSHDFTEALADFRKVLELDAAGGFADSGRFRVWLSRAQLGDTEDASVELRTYLAGRTEGKPNDWPSRVGHFLAGQMAEPAFLAAARNANPKTEAVLLCDAYFYAGSKHLLANDKATAQDYFQKSVATDAKSSWQYFSAAAELKFLKEEKK